MNELKRFLDPRLLIQLIIVLVIFPFLPLLISQQWDWWQAWAFAVVFILGFVVSRVLVARKYPDLIAERAQGLEHEDAKEWDRALAPIVGLAFGVIALVAGLDARFGWSEAFGTTANVVALAVIVGGFALGTYAMLHNRFFSGMVRIQTDRGHEVESTGPYRWVRHPGYVSAIMTYIASPILLDSLWALLPALAVLVVLVVRTRLEDETLKAELEGYDEYAERTRYRLLPGVW